MGGTMSPMVTRTKGGVDVVFEAPRWSKRWVLEDDVTMPESSEHEAPITLVKDVLRAWVTRTGRDGGNCSFAPRRQTQQQYHAVRQQQSHARLQLPGGKRDRPFQFPAPDPAAARPFRPAQDQLVSIDCQLQGPPTDMVFTQGCDRPGSVAPAEGGTVTSQHPGLRPARKSEWRHLPYAASVRMKNDGKQQPRLASTAGESTHQRGQGQIGIDRCRHQRAWCMKGGFLESLARAVRAQSPRGKA